MSEKVEKVLKKMHDFVNSMKMDNIYCADKRTESGSYSGWAPQYLGRVVGNETVIRFWESAIRVVSKMYAEGVSEKDVYCNKLAEDVCNKLAEIRDEFRRGLIDDAVHTSSNEVANQVSLFEREALRRIVSYGENYEYSVSWLLAYVFDIHDNSYPEKYF